MQALARMDDKRGRNRARPRPSHPETRENPPGSEDAKGQLPQEAPSHDGFDRWLDRSLHRLFDGVASEPVPDELMKLVGGTERSPALREKGSGKQHRAKGDVSDKE